MKTRYYLLSFARACIDNWAFGEAVCSGQHPLEWVAEQRRAGPTIRLVSWAEITKAEFDRFKSLVQA